MSQAHIVKLTYTNGSLSPDPNPVLVRVGDTLNFDLVSPPNGDLTITMADPDLFSTGRFKPGDSPIRVNKTAHTTYSCQVSVGGVVVAMASGKNGGEIDPATGGT